LTGKSHGKHTYIITTPYALNVNLYSTFTIILNIKQKISLSFVVVVGVVVVVVVVIIVVVVVVMLWMFFVVIVGVVVVEGVASKDVRYYVNTHDTLTLHTR